jgi:hypothetical protein
LPRIVGVEGVVAIDALFGQPGGKRLDDFVGATLPTRLGQR